jgi:hypothetical protein
LCDLDRLAEVWNDLPENVREAIFLMAGVSAPKNP